MTRRELRFTLIELLVVVAIISVLAAMLLPALSKARGLAQQTACLNQEKQLYLGLAMYADEEDGYVPVFKYKPGAPQPWPEVIAPYVNAPPGEHFGLHYLPCPSRQGGWTWYTYGGLYSTHRGTGSFVIYQEGLYRGSGRLNSLKPTCMLVGDSRHYSIDSPRRWPLTYDADGDGYNDLVNSSYSLSTLYARAEPRHRRGMNFIFADGHGSWHSLREFLANANEMFNP